MVTRREISDDTFRGPPEANDKRLDISRLLTGSYVYFLYKGKTLQYVGKTTCVLTRIGAHKKRFPFDRVEVLKVQQRRAAHVERLFIQRLNPRYNIMSHPKQYERSRIWVNQGYDRLSHNESDAPELLESGV